VFLAKRYRLGDTDAKLDAWFLGMGTLVETTSLEIDISGRFELWDDAGALALLERVDIVYPFFFDYEKTEKDVNIRQRYAVQLDPSIFFKPSPSWGLRLSGRIAVPFGREGDSGGDGATQPSEPAGGVPDAPTGDKSVHGGMLGRIELIVGL
jgi:hypothetical protein